MTKAPDQTFRQQLISEGVPLAYQALKRVLEDPKASATALASAARTVMDIAGLTKPSDSDKPKEGYEMTADELQAAIQRLRDEQPDDGVFQ